MLKIKYLGKITDNKDLVTKEYVDQGLEDKVDKVTGKGLSTNDYTTTEKNKLSGIASGAEVNVQSDWNVTDTTSDAFIKNKPTIPDVSKYVIADDEGSAVDPNPINADLLEGHNADYFYVEVINNLTSSLTAAALSANQGKVLKGLIDALDALISSLDEDLTSVQSSVSNLETTVSNKASINNPTFTGTANFNIAKGNAGTDYSTPKFRNITLSTEDPSGGNNGDIWIKYAE